MVAAIVRCSHCWRRIACLLARAILGWVGRLDHDGAPDLIPSDATGLARTELYDDQVPHDERGEIQLGRGCA